MRRIIIVVGTRPNFIKVTQFKKEIAKYPNLEALIVHTGQHYDEKMADVFFRQFHLIPDHFLNIGKGSANNQIASIMVALETYFNEIRPDLVMVVGDVNSTLAAALTANKLNIPIAHLESGLRSGDMTMPEEVNRILTDRITSLFFVTEQSGLDHLKSEGQEDEDLHFVGNTMIDTMVAFESEIQASPIMEELGLKTKEFVLMTIHRPATVDDLGELKKLIDLMAMVTGDYALVFPIHPRTVKNLMSFGLYESVLKMKGLYLTEPMGYFSFQKLVKEAAFILTDSGGIQEESTYRQVPCLTLRPNTERPSTIDLGSNVLVPFDLEIIGTHIKEIVGGTFKKGQIPPLWDGQATSRVVTILNQMTQEYP